MPKKTEGIPDSDNPEWTSERAAKAMRFKDLSPRLQQVLAPRKARGPQQTSTKKLVSIRLSPDVLMALRAKGKGWQGMVDEVLREEFVKKVS